MAGEAERFEVDVGMGLSIVGRYVCRMDWVNVVEGTMSVGGGVGA